MTRIFVIVILLTILSCDITSAEEASEANLRTALDELELAFNFHHLDEIMVHYSTEYLHNGDDWEDVELDWNIRLNDFQEMELENVVMDIGDGRATVSFNRRFLNNSIMEEVLIDPEENGDMSFWEREFDEWKIIGNKKIY